MLLLEGGDKFKLRATDFMLCLGIDSGTTSTKALVIDFDNGKVVASAQRHYGIIEGLPHGHVEQAPETWTEAAEAAIRECLDKVGPRKKEIQGIGVSAQQHGLVVLD